MKNTLIGVQDFLLAKIDKPTWTKTTKFQGAKRPEILWFWSCVGINPSQQDDELQLKSSMLQISVTQNRPTTE